MKILNYIDRLFNGLYGKADGSVNKGSLSIWGIMVTLIATTLGIIVMFYIPEEALNNESGTDVFIHIFLLIFFVVMLIHKVIVALLLYKNVSIEGKPLKSLVGTGKQHIFLPRSEYKLGEVILLVSIMFYFSSIGFSMIAIANMVMIFINGFLTEHYTDKKENQEQ